MVELRDKFIAKGIPYDELDVEMIPILNVLIFEMNINTKYCCYGHTANEKTYIMFEDNVEDSQMVKVVEAVDSLKEQRTQVFKWMRKTWEDRIVSNWFLEIKNGSRYGNKEEYHEAVVNKLKSMGGSA